MRRFSIVGRLGPDDKNQIDILERDSATYEIDFLNANRRLGFGIGRTLDELTSLGLTPREMAVDLVLIAALVNAGDTRISRTRNAQDGWAREIDLYAPVSDEVVWGGLSREIVGLLKFLTGDRWRIFFRDRPARMSSIVTRTSTLVHGFDEVCLFSGGLDSFIGAIDSLKAGRCPLFTSHYWDSETSKAQAYLLARLRKHFPKSKFGSIRTRTGFDRDHLNTGEREGTQRSRSFLFFALAAFAASALAASTVDETVAINVPENGLIALNVPLDPLRLGALSTRTAHPYSISSMNELLDFIGVGGTLVNRYRHHTKGEMVSACTDIDFLRKNVGHSMSCSSPTKGRFGGSSPKHCGYCVPCIIRRASLRAGLGMPDPTEYAIPDLSAQTLFTDKSEGEHVRSFQLMARRVQDRPELAEILVYKPGPLRYDPSETRAYSNVFRRGVLEVAALLDGVEARPS